MRSLITFRLPMLLAAFAALSTCRPLSSAALADPGVTADRILFGTTHPLTGPTKGNSLDLLEGIHARFDATNAKGGINGRKLELKVYDDGYDARKGAENVNTLIDKDGVFALVNVFGSKVLAAVLPTAESRHVPLIGPSSGSETLRQFRKDVVIFRATAGDEAEALVAYLVDRSNAKNLTVMHQDDSFGSQGLNSIQKAMAKRGMKVREAISYDPRNAAASGPMDRARASNPDAIVLWGDEVIGVPFLKYAAAHGMKMPVAAPSNMLTDRVLKETGSAADGMILSSVYPLSSDTSLELVRDYQRDVQAIGKSVAGLYGLQGYFTAAVTEEALKAAGKDLTRESFIKGFESLNGKKVAGIKLKLSPTDHQATSDVFLVRAEKGKFVPLK